MNQKTNKSFQPFGNDSQNVLCSDENGGEINITNGKKTISIFGDLEIGKDQEGLRNVTALIENLSEVKVVIEAALLAQKTKSKPNTNIGG